VINLRRIVLIALLPLLLAACEMRVWLDVDMDSATAGEVTITMGFDEEFREMIDATGEGADIFSDLETEASDDGFNIEPFTDGDIEGVRISRSFSSIEELNEILNDSPSISPTGDDDVVDEVRFTDNGDTILFEGSVPDASGDFEGIDPSQAMDLIQFDARVSVTFSGDVAEHNGELSGRTVTWIFYDEDFAGIEMFAEARKAGGGLSGAVIAAVLLVLVVIGAIVYRMVTSKKTDTVADPTIPEEPLPAVEPTDGPLA
jgi:hypothetical protein